MIKGVGPTKQVLRPPEVRGTNRAAVLSLLQQNDYMSRADVARQSGLSEGAISRITNALMKDGLVCEDGAENSTGGRPGRRLKLDERRVIFGAEIQNWETRCAVATMQGRLVETRRFRTPNDPEETLEAIAATFLDFRKSRGNDRLPGIGICTRGIVNSETGHLVVGSRPGWENIAIRRSLEARLREPVFVENNVRAAALAEYTFTSAGMLNKRCFVFVKVDEGVGMGVLFDGKLYHGPHMAAGEFGEMIIELGKTDTASERGSVEDLISDPAVCRRFSELNGNKQRNNSGDTSARVRSIVQSAIAGEAVARRTLDETSRYLGVSVSNLVWTLDADTIVVDGAVMEAWNLVEPVLQRQLPNHLTLHASRKLQIKPSALGGEAALMGAAILPLKSIFSHGSSALLRRRIAG
jgi:predicted NBD/HSP70 family sugar kinase